MSMSRRALLGGVASATLAAMLPGPAAAAARPTVTVYKSAT